MKKPQKSRPDEWTVAGLARELGCPYEGAGDTIVKDVSSLESAGKGDLVYYAEDKFRPLLDKTGASAAVIPSSAEYGRIPVIKSENPHMTFIRAVELFFSPYRPRPGIHPQAFVSPAARIGERVSIGAFAVIADDVTIAEGTVVFPLASVYPGVNIGKDCLVHSHVSLREGVQIGNRVILHNGVVIGSDGYGYLREKSGAHRKIPQKGGIIVEDDVEIGANSTIDRAALGNTVIKKGTKIDNLVQVAHNVEIGKDCILAGQVGIAGSCKVGNDVVLAGQVGIADHVEIGDGAIAAAKSGITKNVAAGSMVAGSPHLDIRDWRKVWASLPQVYELIREVRKLKKRIEALEPPRD